jgi:CBS domain containing-hemolysin-like protein
MIAGMSSAMEWVLWLALAAAGTALTALYDGAETGLYVLNKMRLDLRAESGSRPARLLRDMLGTSASVLAVLLIGTNIATYVTTFAVSVLFVHAGAGDRAEWYTLAVVTPLLFILGESVPKNLFQRSPERLVYPLVWFLRASSAVFTACGLLPLVRALASVLPRRRRLPLAHEGLAALLAEGQASGALTHAQTIMADRVMHLTDVLVADVMKPLRQVVTAPRDTSREQLVELVRRHNYTRLPLVEADGAVAGILDIYDVLMAPGPVLPEEKMTPPLLVLGGWTVSDALYHMQQAHQTLAVVTDARGATVGIVTIKDLVEQIVGELAAW